jgi:hypothetical protein
MTELKAVYPWLSRLPPPSRREDEDLGSALATTGLQNACVRRESVLAPELLEDDA